MAVHSTFCRIWNQTICKYVSHICENFTSQTMPESCTANHYSIRTMINFSVVFGYVCICIDCVRCSSFWPVSLCTVHAPSLPPLGYQMVHWVALTETRAHTHTCASIYSWVLLTLSFSIALFQPLYITNSTRCLTIDKFKEIALDVQRNVRSSPKVK